MKIITEVVKDKDKIVNQKEVEKRNIISNLVPQNGHKCFELNLETDEITEADYVEVTTTLDGKVSKRINIKPNCLYQTALNKKNALKHFKRLFIKK